MFWVQHKLTQVWRDAGRGMRVKMDEGFFVRDDKNVMAGCVIKILRQKQDLLILSGSMRDSFKIDGIDAG